jgi:hypothetical protein
MIDKRVGGICCVLGTLGRFHEAPSLPFTVLFATTSFAFLLPVLEDFFSLSGLACGGLAGTSWPWATPLEPSAGLEGFEEENRL